MDTVSLFEKMLTLLEKIRTAKAHPNMGPMEKQGTLMLLSLEMTVAVNQAQLALLTTNSQEMN